MKFSETWWSLSFLTPTVQCNSIITSFSIYSILKYGTIRGSFVSFLHIFSVLSVKLTLKTKSTKSAPQQRKKHRTRCTGTPVLSFGRSTERPTEHYSACSYTAGKTRVSKHEQPRFHGARFPRRVFARVAIASSLRVQSRSSEEQAAMKGDCLSSSVAQQKKRVTVYKYQREKQKSEERIEVDATNAS